MNTVFVSFSNHFDLVWRRCWDRDYTYGGQRYLSYRQVEEFCIARNLELAEAGRGAYVLEQSLSLRAYLERHPADLPRLQALYRRGLFELLGAGEAIVDVNMASLETIGRNLGSGVRYARELGMPPFLACHNDGFGSSAQFPQIVRLCGLPGLAGISYSVPDNRYWRGLDGSTILIAPGAPGRSYFFDHCYHEPCRRCRGHGCDACRQLGIDLPQNTYPPFEPVPPDAFREGLAQYSVCSEEMLPPEDFAERLARWRLVQPEVDYRWGTNRFLQPLWQALAAAVDAPPPELVASRVENNPVQTGCLVSRRRSRQLARRCEALLYGWETALAAGGLPLDPARWEPLFRELPLFFFHDAVTGTHQDLAHEELLDRMAAMQRQVVEAGIEAVHGTPPALAPGSRFQASLPALAPGSARIPLPLADWRQAPPLIARTPDGRAWPVVYPWHPWSPPLPPCEGRLIAGVGSSSRTRPEAGEAFVETDGLHPLAWTELRLECAADPRPLEASSLRNGHLEVCLGEHGVATIRDLATGAAIDGESCAIGGLLLEEDVGDPWGTRQLPAFRRELAPFTRLLGVTRFDGYAEAVYAGRYEPNLRFGREQDPSIFALEWQVTVRLLDHARRVDFEIEAVWQSLNRRLRAAFPAQAPTDTAWYSIPGGWLARHRYEQTETALWSPNGDWPALHAVATQPAPGAHGWAVVNYGSPAARVEDGRILVSFLRSPGFGHCLQRYAQAYPMPASGIRDGGWHHLTLSLIPHAGLDDLPRLMAEASRLNLAPPAVAAARPLPAAPWRLEGADVELAAAKAPFGKSAGETILRLLNLRADPNEAVLHLPPGMAAAADLLTEDASAPLAPAGAACPLSFRPFELRTVRLTARPAPPAPSPE